MMFKYMCLVLFITWYQLADCHPASTGLQSIDSLVDKESEAFLSTEAEDSSQNKNVRDKRTIGILRQLFPNLSQIVDRKIQQITRIVFRVIGRLVLRGGGAGNGGGGGGTGTGTGTNGSNGGRRVSITLPTYPPSADDEDETETPAESTTSAAAPQPSDAAAGVTSDAPPAAAAAAADATDSAPAASAESTDSVADVTVTTTATSGASSTQPATTQLPSDSDNTVGTSIVKRVVREVSTESNSALKQSPLTDTENAASSDLSNTNDDAQAETTNEDPRNKRFLLNLRGSGGGSGGGSGNFLFDLIRLVAGSGANQDRDESSQLEADPQEVHTDVNAKEDGYSVGVPGPLTRIFIIANRGVANLVQDLILRLAQTTERIVNFKARLITSLI